MGPDPAATGDLSSQLAGMSKCGAPPGVQSCDAVRVSAQTPPHRVPGSVLLTAPPWRSLSGRRPTTLRLPLDPELPMAWSIWESVGKSPLLCKGQDWAFLTGCHEDRVSSGGSQAQASARPRACSRHTSAIEGTSL